MRHHYLRFPTAELFTAREWFHNFQTSRSENAYFLISNTIFRTHSQYFCFTYFPAKKGQPVKSMIEPIHPFSPSCSLAVHMSLRDVFFQTNSVRTLSLPGRNGCSRCIVTLRDPPFNPIWERVSVRSRWHTMMIWHTRKHRNWAKLSLKTTPPGLFWAGFSRTPVVIFNREGFYILWKSCFPPGTSPTESFVSVGILCVNLLWGFEKVSTNTPRPLAVPPGEELSHSQQLLRSVGLSHLSDTMTSQLSSGGQEHPMIFSLFFQLIFSSVHYICIWYFIIDIFLSFLIFHCLSEETTNLIHKGRRCFPFQNAPKYSPNPIVGSTAKNSIWTHLRIKTQCLWVLRCLRLFQLLQKFWITFAAKALLRCLNCERRGTVWNPKLCVPHLTWSQPFRFLFKGHEMINGENLAVGFFLSFIFRLASKLF